MTIGPGAGRERVSPCPEGYNRPSPMALAPGSTLGPYDILAELGRSPAMSPAMTLGPGTRLGPYTIRAELGSDPEV